MASDIDFVNFVCDQVADAGVITFKKMFGDYMVYCDGKPALLVCDNIAYVKMLPEVSALFDDYQMTPEIGTPYKGAKEHFILDCDNGGFASEMTRLLARILPMPKPRKK
jgi:hypothetical protein